MCKVSISVMAKYKTQFALTSKVLQQLITTENSCVEIENNKKHLTLFPYHLKNISTSVREILDEDIARYNKDLDGILLGCKNIKLLTDLGYINSDSCFIHADIQADFIVFKPVPEKELPAIVTKKSRDHVGCLVYHTFNVSLPKPDGIENWTGNDVEIGQEIIVRVTYANLDAKLPYIRGEFLNNISEYTDSIYKKPVNKRKKFDEGAEELIEPKVKEKKKSKKKNRNIEENPEKNFDEEIDIEIKSTISKKKKKKRHDNTDTSTEEPTIKNKKILSEEELEYSFDTGIIKNSIKKKRKHSLTIDNYTLDVELQNGSARKKKKHSKIKE